LKLLARGEAPVDTIVADAGGAGLKIYVDAPEAVTAVAEVLENARAAAARAARGPIKFCLMAPGLPGEVEIEAGDEFPVNPQIKGAIKTLQGVLTVEDE
jgi:DNA polymerase-3 subunit alpha